MTMGGAAFGRPDLAEKAQKGKTGGSGDPRAYDRTIQQMTTAAALTPQQKAVAGALSEAKRQSDLQAPGLAVAETILGLVPSPAMIGIGPALKLGKMMSDQSVSDLTAAEAKTPGTIKIDTAHPGSIYGRINGMMYSNEADVPGYHENLGKQEGSNDQSSLGDDDLTNKKKKAAQGIGPAASPTTLLGSPVDLLGPVNAIS